MKILKSRKKGEERDITLEKQVLLQRCKETICFSTKNEGTAELLATTLKMLKVRAAAKAFLIQSTKR